MSASARNGHRMIVQLTNAELKTVLLNLVVGTLEGYLCCHHIIRKGNLNSRSTTKGIPFTSQSK
jgi:hypothetical protein